MGEHGGSFFKFPLSPVVFVLQICTMMKSSVRFIEDIGNTKKLVSSELRGLSTANHRAADTSLVAQ